METEQLMPDTWCRCCSCCLNCSIWAWMVRSRVWCSASTCRASCSALSPSSNFSEASCTCRCTNKNQSGVRIIHSYWSRHRFRHSKYSSFHKMTWLNRFFWLLYTTLEKCISWFCITNCTTAASISVLSLHQFQIQYCSHLAEALHLLCPSLESNGCGAQSLLLPLLVLPKAVQCFSLAGYCILPLLQFPCSQLQLSLLLHTHTHNWRVKKSYFFMDRTTVNRHLANTDIALDSQWEWESIACLSIGNVTTDLRSQYYFHV